MLTAKQERFVEEYLVDLNASAAARRAGYSANRADAMGHENLRKPVISTAIAQRKSARSERTQIDSDWVLRTLAAEKTADLSELYDDDGDLKPVKDWPPVFRRGLVVGVESVEDIQTVNGERVKVGAIRKVKLSDRVRHLELIGKHVDVQAWRENQALTGPGGGPIQVVEMTPAEFRILAEEIARKT